MNLRLAFLGYLGAAAAFAAFTVALVTVWQQRVRGSLLTLASAVTVVWAIGFAVTALLAQGSASRVFIIEMIHDLTWLVCLSSLLGGAVAVRSNWLVRRGGVVLALVLLLIGVVLELTGLDSRFPGAAIQLLLLGSIATSLYALVGVEQLYRNARPRQQNGLKFFCLGLAGIFAYDLLLYSNAVVDGQISTDFWGARGYVVALCMPLLAVSVKRIESWHRGIFASRQVVFYTTTLFAAGIYLVLVGFAGYYIQTLGKEWGDALQLVFFSVAVLGFFILVMSDQVRARIRVWLVKHFFERKYDYREEWLRLIHTLTGEEDSLPLKKRAIKSLAQIIGSPSGRLWLENKDAGRFDCVSSWDLPPEPASLAVESPLVRYMAAKEWIIDVRGLRSDPKKYEPLTPDDLPGSLQEAGFLLPLMHEQDLLGLVAVSKPQTPIDLNFEDHDLLKTAGRQVASYLAQEQSAARLAESRQFEAYNRFTAFVMHDLKNAIAQQSLVVENAERHKHNPEFIDDAIETIKGSVVRMRRVLGHLRQGLTDQASERVDLTKVLLEVQSQISDRKPVPRLEVPDHPVLVQANRERLASAITHAVRNAQDASAPDDSVTLTLKADGAECLIFVSDTGSGMDDAFVRDRLFRPFDSTKGAEGMGIGAYQIRETIRAIGGEVSIDSQVGRGTTMILQLPLAGAPS